MKRWNHRSGEGRSEMSNRWLVRVRGDERTAKTVAELHGFRLIGRVSSAGLANWFTALINTTAYFRNLVTIFLHCLLHAVHFKHQSLYNLV